MNRLRFYWFLFVTGVVIHGFMWINLSRHFTRVSLFPPIWKPVLTPDHTPPHWRKDAAPKGPFADTRISRFETLFKQHLKNTLDSNALMEMPRRKTHNMGLELFLRDATRTDPGGDFFQLYRSGLDARSGVGIYENYPAGFNMQSRKKTERAIPLHPPNRYPPPFAYTIGIWLSAMPIWTSYFVWVILHEIVLLGCMILSFRVPATPPHRLGMLAMWLGFTPWYLELYMGQTTFIIMVTVLVLGLYLMRRASGFHTGSWFTLSLITKPMTLLFYPLLLKKKRFTLMLLPLLLAGTGTALYFYFHPADIALFFRWMAGADMPYTLGNYCFQNLLYHFLFSGKTTHFVLVLLPAAGIALTFFSSWHPVRLLSFWVCIYFLAYTHIWQHHQILLLPAVILPFLITGRERFWIPWLLATFPSPFYWFEGHWNWLRRVLYLSWGVLPIFVLILTLIFFWPGTGKDTS